MEGEYELVQADDGRHRGGSRPCGRSAAQGLDALCLMECVGDCDADVMQS
jgi:hypothetical protein